MIVERLTSFEPYVEAVEGYVAPDTLPRSSETNAHFRPYRKYCRQGNRVISPAVCPSPKHFVWYPVTWHDPPLVPPAEISSSWNSIEISRKAFASMWRKFPRLEAHHLTRLHLGFSDHTRYGVELKMVLTAQMGGKLEASAPLRPDDREASDAEVTPTRQPNSFRSMGSRKRVAKLDPALKSWLNNAIIPALVRNISSKLKGTIDLRPMAVHSYVPSSPACVNSP